MLADPLSGLRALGRRSLLALLGTVMGCATVTAMISIGQGATQDAMAVFQRLGADLLMVNIETNSATAVPLAHDFLADSPARAIAGIRSLAPFAASGWPVMTRGKAHYASLVASTPELANALQLSVREGRLLTDLDSRQTFAVVGAQAAHRLGSDGQPLGLGESIRIHSYLFTVIGILQPHSGSLLVPVTADESIFVPLAGLRRLDSTGYPNHLVVRVQDGQDSPRIAADLSQALEPLLSGRELRFQVPQQMIDSMQGQDRTFVWLLAGLGALALVGSGVGIMNVMVMNVAQRRREIGIRIALGARRRDIRDMFLAQAMVLTLGGALIGAALGVAGAWAYAQMAGWAVGFMPLAVLLGVGSTVFTGLFFGLYPALQASRLQPVVALRDE